MAGSINIILGQQRPVIYLQIGAQNSIGVDIFNGRYAGPPGPPGPGGGGVWGSITGTITSQTDLITLINNSVAPYLKRDGTTTLTGNWNAGSFSILANGVTVGNAANSIQINGTSTNSIIRHSNSVNGLLVNPNANGSQFYVADDCSEIYMNVVSFHHAYMDISNSGITISMDDSAGSAVYLQSNTLTLDGKTNPVNITGSQINHNVKSFFTASVAGAASINIGPGTDPSSPANGDLWISSSTNHIFARINGVTYQLDQQAPTGVLKADGSVPLTANWNAGAFSITANSVILGNAANQIALGSASGGSGTITSTSSATKGNIYFGSAQLSYYDEANSVLNLTNNSGLTALNIQNTTAATSSIPQPVQFLLSATGWRASGTPASVPVLIQHKVLPYFIAAAEPGVDYQISTTIDGTNVPLANIGTYGTIVARNGALLNSGLEGFFLGLGSFSMSNIINTSAAWFRLISTSSGQVDLGFSSSYFLTFSLGTTEKARFGTNGQFIKSDLALATTQSESAGIILQNTTAAAAGAQQISPAVRWEGQGWATTPVASQRVDWIAYVLPVQGAANPGSQWLLQYAVNSGSYATAIAVSSSGAFLTISAGTTAIAPLQLTSGTNLTTAVNGAFEYNGTNLFFTRTGAVRESVLTGNSGATAPATIAYATPTNVYGSATTTILATPNSWASVVIGGTTYKIPLYT